MKTLEQVMREWESLKRQLPTIVGNIALNFYRDRFRQQSWINDRTESWRKRKGNKNTGRSILVKTGRLRRGTRIVATGPDYVKMGNDVPYAKPNNEGFRGVVTVKAHTRSIHKKLRTGTGTFSLKTKKENQRSTKVKTGKVKVKAYRMRMNIPRRQFFGYSNHLNRLIEREIARRILKILT